MSTPPLLGGLPSPQLTRAFGQARDLLAEAADALAQADDSDASSTTTLARRLAAEAKRLAQPADQPPSIVVVGEVKSGKSSLINALVRRPRLSPVDASIATSAYIEFAGASEDIARVHLLPPEGANADANGDRSVLSHPVALGEIADWATEQGNPGNSRGVRSVEVGLTTPLLRELRIIDTPGVGGLATQHLASTLLALGLADALLLIVDARREISRDGLAFLDRAADRVDTVIIVLTKKDIHDDAAAVLAANRRLLAEHDSRFAEVPMLLVSSVQAEEALEEPDERFAEDLRALSGLDELEALLSERLGGQAAMLRIRNAARISALAFETAESRFEDLLSAADGGEEYRREMEQRRAELEAMQDEASDWPIAVRSDLEAITDDALKAFLRATTALRSDSLKRAQKLPLDQAEAFKGTIADAFAQARAKLWADTGDAVSEMLREALPARIRGEELEHRWSSAEAGGHEGTLEFDELEDPELSLFETMQALAGLAIGRGAIGTVGTAIGASAFFATPVVGVFTLGAGFVYVKLATKHRKEQLTRAQLQTTVRDAIDQSAVQARDEYSAAMRAFREALSKHVRQRLREELRRIDVDKRENERALHRTDDENNRRRRELTAARDAAHRSAESCGRLLRDSGQVRLGPVGARPGASRWAR